MTVQIGPLLKDARRRLLMTQFEVAVKAGVSPATVSSAESDRPISLKIARRIAKVMGINLTAHAA